MGRCLIPLTQAAFGCAPLGRTSRGGRSALPRHFVPRRCSSPLVIPVKTGIQCRLVRCMPPRMDSRFRGNDECENGCSGSENGLSGAKKAVRPQKPTRPDGPRAGQARPSGAQPKAACVSEMNSSCVSDITSCTPFSASAGVDFLQPVWNADLEHRARFRAFHQPHITAVGANQFAGNRQSEASAALAL